MKLFDIDFNDIHEKIEVHTCLMYAGRYYTSYVCKLQKLLVSSVLYIYIYIYIYITYIWIWFTTNISKLESR